MQQYTVPQEQQTCVLQDDMQHFIQEISALRSLAEVAGVAGPLLAELDVFKHKVEHIDARAWEQKEVHTQVEWNALHVRREVHYGFSVDEIRRFMMIVTSLLFLEVLNATLLQKTASPLLTEGGL